MSHNPRLVSDSLFTTSYKKSRISLGNHIGTSSILLIFVVLCFVSFAALSLISANADYILTRKVADRTASYYDACNTAERRIYQDPSSSMQFPLSDNQWLQVTIEQQDGVNRITEYRVYTDTDSMQYNESLPVFE